MMRYLRLFESFDFDFDNDCYYIYLEGPEKCVLKFTRDYDWTIELEEGSYPSDMESTFRSNYDIDYIIELLSQKYTNVEEISEEDIDDYI